MWFMFMLLCLHDILSILFSHVVCFRVKKRHPAQSFLCLKCCFDRCLCQVSSERIGQHRQCLARARGKMLIEFHEKGSLVCNLAFFGPTVLNVFTVV